MFRSYAFVSTLLARNVKTSRYTIDGSTITIDTDKDYNSITYKKSEELHTSGVTKAIITVNGWTNKALDSNPLFYYMQEVTFQGNDNISVGPLFSSNLFIRSVSFKTPNIEKISDYCFSNSSIENVDIALVKNIGLGCFIGCTNLKEINSPKLQIIPENFASFCFSLTTVDISGATQINDYAFAYSGVTTITLPQTINLIGFGAFKCSSLSSITFPNTVTGGSLTICELAFLSTPLESVNIPEYVQFKDDEISNEGYFSESLNLKTINIFSRDIPADFARNCLNLETLTAPNCLSIGDFAFLHCESLETITLSSNIASFGKAAFAYCYKMNYQLPNNAISIGDYSFIYCNNLKQEVAYNSWTLGKNSFTGCSGITQLRLNCSLNKGNRGVYQNCYNLKTLLVETIYVPRYCFAFCLALTKVDFAINSTVCDFYSFLHTGPIEYINTSLVFSLNYAFMYSQVKTVYCYGLNNNNNSNLAFAHDKALTLAVICYDAALSFPAVAFINCTNIHFEFRVNTRFKIVDNAICYVDDYDDKYLFIFLPEFDRKTVEISDTKYYSLEDFFLGANTNIEKLIIDQPEILLQNNAFSKCLSVKEIIIKRFRNKDIDYLACWDCYSLERIEWPDEGFLDIMPHFFQGCTRLKYIKMPTTCRSIGFQSFQYCTALNDLDISRVDLIASYAFYGCSSLTNIKISKTLKYIDTCAFGGCPIKSFTVPDTCQFIDEYAFSNMKYLKKLEIGKSCLYIYPRIVYQSNVETIILPKTCLKIAEDAFDSAPYAKVSFSGKSPYFKVIDHSIVDKISGRLICTFGALPLDYSIPDGVEYIPSGSLRGNQYVIDSPSGNFLKEPTATILRISETVRYGVFNSLKWTYAACTKGSYFFSSQYGSSSVSAADSNYANPILFNNFVGEDDCDKYAKNIPKDYLWYHENEEINNSIRRNLIISIVFFCIFIVAIIVLYFLYPSTHFMPKLCGKTKEAKNDLE